MVSRRALPFGNPCQLRHHSCIAYQLVNFRTHRLCGERKCHLMVVKAHGVWQMEAVRFV